MTKSNIFRFKLFLAIFLVALILMALILAKPTFNSGAGKVYYTQEDSSPIYTYNFSANVTDLSPGDRFTFIGLNVTPINPSLDDPIDFYFIDLDSNTGIMTINSTLDNESGSFNVSLNVVNTTGWGDTAPFYFVVNATNDFPVFTTLNSSYVLVQNISFSTSFDATDEESHYPLRFNISFFDNCSLAAWSNRTNCTLLTVNTTSNTTGSINHTALYNDVGIYYANLTVMDYGANYACSSGYCSNDYSENKTTYSSIVTFNVLSILDVDISDCQNSIFQENQSNTCNITIYTKGATDGLDIETHSFLRNYVGNVANTSWFYSDTTTTSADFTKILVVNVTPDKAEVGNWTIQLNVTDTTTGDNSTTSINIYVNRSYNANPYLNPISDVITSIDFLTTINLSAYDNDHLIPDRNASFGGFDEISNFTLQVFNRSNFSDPESVTGFNIDVLSMPVGDTNQTTAEIVFTAVEADIGNYTVNITVNDVDGAIFNRMFNLSIINNTAPLWNDSKGYTFNWTANSTYASTQIFTLDLQSGGYVWDIDAGDTLTFENTTSSMLSFNMDANGLINFTPYKLDVGMYNVTILVTDALGLTNSSILTFNLSNINTAPIIIKSPTGNEITDEDNVTSFTFFIDDDDILIRDKALYNESHLVNLTISGPNTNLFTLTKTGSVFPLFPNRTEYVASFVPNKTDVGVYLISLNITDINNASVALNFNLTVNEINHGPEFLEILNQTLTVNSTFSYHINATDVEDGNSNDSASGNPNITFSYSFVNDGLTPGFLNSTNFNTSTGLINAYLNSSQGGSYHVNITANDSVGKVGSVDFWVFVYDTPLIEFPGLSNTFSLVENTSANITVRAVHTMQDNLTYAFYVNGNLRSSMNYYGNSTNLTWAYTPGFNDETNGSKNLTLLVYNADYPSLNATRAWNTTVAYTNYPLQFYSNIGGGGGTVVGTSPYTLTLSDYFRDLDANDSLHYQVIGFIDEELSVGGGNITTAITNWTNGTNPTIVFTASSDSVALYRITGYEINETDSSVIRSVVSNNFTLTLNVDTTPQPQIVPSSGGGGSVPVPVSFKLIAPGQVSATFYQYIDIPLELQNTGTQGFNEITLKNIVYSDRVLDPDIEAKFSNNYFSSLAPGQSHYFNLTVYLNTNETGVYEIVINATSENPEYTDWAIIQVNVLERNTSSSEEMLIFTEEFIARNPECAEITEVLNEAKRFFNAGLYEQAKQKAQIAIDACKEFISQAPIASPRYKFKEIISNTNNYLILATILAFLAGIAYYAFKRSRFKRTVLGTTEKYKKESSIS
ncbi:hypothetical protein GOV14_04380 [Candidatus Pacearchaeota archaeon]|nr:hypothetical protein [Candidatus Pacearchaeota archaeon]